VTLQNRERSPFATAVLGVELRALTPRAMRRLLNTLVGDMSLIGPRPLLPRDQPKYIEIRLVVRPGITGWAQVNGGALLSLHRRVVHPQRLAVARPAHHLHDGDHVFSGDRRTKQQSFAHFH